MCQHLLILGFVSLGLLISQDAGSAASRAYDDSSAESTTPGRPTSLRISSAVVCRSIDGYENYEKLAPASLTSDEKLLVYYRPLQFASALIEGTYQAHFTQDGVIRKRGEKTVVRQKQKLLDCTAKDSSVPPHHLFLRNTVSLKGLSPGEYDFVIILHDEIAKGPPATQVVKFRVVAADTVAGPDDEQSEKSDSESVSKNKRSPRKTRSRADTSPNS